MYFMVAKHAPLESFLPMPSSPARLRIRRPRWACPSYEQHGEDAVCGDCLGRFQATEHLPEPRPTLPPTVAFGRGWISIGITHWFEADDASVFPSRDGRTLLAQSLCGLICHVTIARAPRSGEGDRCKKCLLARNKVRRDDKSVDGPDSVAPARPRRLYRGLTRSYDPRLVNTDRRSGTNFTDCPFAALSYAVGTKGVILIVDAPEDSPRITEEMWLNTAAKRHMIHGAFDDLLVGQFLAKDLRARLRRKGIVNASNQEKTVILRRHVGTITPGPVTPSAASSPRPPTTRGRGT